MEFRICVWFLSLVCTTLFFWVEVSETAVSTKCFRHTSGLTNGCSVPIFKKFPFKGRFKPACQRHDLCYKCNEMEEASGSALDVVHFLQKRGVENKYLNYITKEKIDPHTLLVMSDDQLHAYIPAYGDIYAARRYFSKQMKKDQKNKRTDTLFQRLRRKMGQKDKSSDSEEEVKKTTKKSLPKKTKTSNSTMELSLADRFLS